MIFLPEWHKVKDLYVKSHFVKVRKFFLDGSMMRPDNITDIAVIISTRETTVFQRR